MQIPISMTPTRTYLAAHAALAAAFGMILVVVVVVDALYANAAASP